MQSTRAVLCIGVWSSLGYVKDRDIMATAIMPEVVGQEDNLSEDWDIRKNLKCIFCIILHK